MIRIIAKEYSAAIGLLCTKLDRESVPYEVFLSHNSTAIDECLKNSMDRQSVIMVGDTGKLCSTLAEVFGFALTYDKFAEKNIKEYCKLSGVQIPAQYILDKYCLLPETFIHYASVFGLQCGCGGEYGKCHIYVLPDEYKECERLFDNYIKKDLFKSRGEAAVYCFKVFGLSKRDLEDKLSKLNLKCTVRFDTLNLDSKVTLCFAGNCAKKLVADSIEAFRKEFQGFVYATEDKTLAQTVVGQLSERYRTVATAESVTGGLITSLLVEVSGASNVLYEGCATYSIDSKCKRLGISPHFIDQYGVVSAQVAKEMAVAQLQFADYAIATTGFAGPTSDGHNPVGLCYIAIGEKTKDKTCVKVFKNVFGGDRNSVRNQVANMALYLLSNAMTNSQFFMSNK